MTKYTEKAKQAVIERYLANKESTRPVLAEAGIPKSTFYCWLKEHNATGGDRSFSVDYAHGNTPFFILIWEAQTFYRLW